MLARELEAIGDLPKAFLDALGVGIVLIDLKDGRVAYANKKFCLLVGYTSEALSDGSVLFSDLTHPEDRELNTQEHLRLLSGEIDHYRLDKRYLTKDGAIVWAHVTASVVSGPGGRERWATRVIEDITERKMLEQKLALAEEIGGLATWNWRIKPDSSDTSSRYNALFGLAEGTPQPSIQQLLDRVHPDDRNSVASSIRRAMKGGGYTQEYRIIKPTGAIRWMRAIATSVVNADNVVTNLVGATIDITDIKERHQPDRTPKEIRRIVKYIEANWNKPISVAEIAKNHGVSSRSIYKHFEAIGITPMIFVKRLKLENARGRLENPGAATSVTGVAFECGFTNLGHFARDYRQAFGELPSDTVRRSRP